jgi:single-strand DNA-binding protein
VVAVCGDAATARGARAIAVGTVRTRTWRGEDGSERSRLEIVADEVGPSLRWDTAQVTKTVARG